MQSWRTKTDRSLKLLSILVAATLPFMGVSLVYASGGVVERYDRLSSSEPSAVASHELGFRFTETGIPVGSISLEFCANDPLPNTPCTFPAGLDASAVVLTAQTGEVGFSIHPNSTANKIILSRPAAIPSGAAVTYTLGNIVNPSTQGTFYTRLQTFTSTDATGVDIESGGMALAINSMLTIQTEVPPYLKFCTSVVISGFDCSTANSFLVDLGEFSSNTVSRASTEFVVATNAASGYSVTVSGSTMTSGNNTLPPLSGNASSPGSSQFGINLRGNSNPSIGVDPSGPGTGSITAGYNTPNTFRFQDGDVLVTSVGVSDNRKFTTSLIANINANQAPGYYATTLTYICLANF